MRSTFMMVFSSRAAQMLTVSMVLATLLFASCEKTEPENTSPVSEEDAVEIAVQAMSYRSGGLAQQTQIALIQSITNLLPLNCGTSKDSVVTKQADSASRSYKVILDWNRTVGCTDDKPSIFTHIFNGSSKYVTEKMSSDDVVKGNFVLSGLTTPGSGIFIDQTYERTGTQQSKINGNHSFSSKIKIVTSGVRVGAGTGYMASGGGAFSFSGTGADGTTFSYSGTIAFQEGNKATLVITGGGTHQISW